jgi:hypothetical protein
MNGANLEMLSGLFYDFRLAHLNRKYYSERLACLKLADTVLSILVMVATASSFSILALGNIPHSTIIAATLSVAAFLIAVAIPILGLGRKIEDLSNRSCAFHYAAQQLEMAIRFIKTAEDKDGEVLGWFSSAREAYRLAGALPDTDAEDQKLIKKVEDEINRSYPANYVWTAF